MREIFYAAWSAVPSKFFAAGGWLITAAITLWPEEAKRWVSWLITPDQIRLWGAVACAVFTFYWLILLILKTSLVNAEAAHQPSPASKTSLVGNSFEGPTVIGDNGTINYHFSASSQISDPHAQSWPGLSIHMVARFHEQPIDRRKVIIHLGGDQDNSASIYLTANNLFIFIIKDKFGDNYSLECVSGGPGISFGEFSIVSAELAIMATKSVIRISLNGQALAERTIPSKIRFDNMDWVNNSVIAANLIGQDKAKIDFGDIFTIARHLTTAERLDLFEYFRKKWEIS